jgi:hypothetical protein
MSPENEAALGEALREHCGRRGNAADGAAFLLGARPDAAAELRRAGLRCDGRACMYNGLTGERHEIEVFAGPAARQWLERFAPGGASPAAPTPPAAPGGAQNGGARSRSESS